MLTFQTSNQAVRDRGECRGLPLPAQVTFLAGTLGQGGAERQLFYILQALRGKGIAARVLTLGRDEHWQEPIQKLGVPVIWVGETRSRMRRLLRICRELRRATPQIVQSQHFYTNLYASLAARWLRLPGIGAIRNDVRSEMSDVGPCMGRLNLNIPHILAANSQAAIRTALGLGISKQRCWLLPNVVDTEKFHPARGEELGCIRILGMGRLVTQKRFDRFLRIIAAVAKRTGKPVRGLIAGAGPLRAQLVQQASELGLAHIEFLDALPEPSSLYREVNIFLLSSDHEGTPNVVLEAMASGLPVVATSVGGTAEIVQEGKTGFLASPEDEEALAARVSQLVESPSLREVLGKEARAYVEQHHAVRRLPEMLSGLYERVTR
jgi:glycosyltransferase involved in cell wall biosynthesis